jgi:hypothetical protein
MARHQSGWMSNESLTSHHKSWSASIQRCRPNSRSGQAAVPYHGKPRHFMERLVPQGRLVTEDFAETGEAEEDAPQHLNGPKCGIYGRAWLVHCFALRSPRFTTFEPPEAASWAFQSRTAWRSRYRSSSPMGGDMAATCDEASFCLYGCFSNTGYLGLRRTQHHNGWGRPETTG